MVTMRGADPQKKEVAMDYLLKFQRSVRLPGAPSLLLSAITC